MKKHKKETILVTGAAGFIGFHTCKQLLEMGYKVIGVDNLNDYYDVRLKKERLKLLKHKNFSFFKLDFANKKQFFSKLNNLKIEKIIHLGAQAGVRYSIENPYVYVESNILGTLNIFEYARQQNIKHVVYASSSSVYGDNLGVCDEKKSNTDKPISLYAASKKSNELLAYSYYHLYKINMIGLRFFTVYGPWGRPDMAIFKFMKAILKGEPLTLYSNGNMERSFTYVSDIVSGVCKSLEVKNGFHVVNLGGSEVINGKRLVSTIEKVLGITAKVVYLPKQPGDVIRTEANQKYSKNLLGIKPKINFTEGIKKTAEWFLQNKKLLIDLKGGKQ